MRNIDSNILVVDVEATAWKYIEDKPENEFQEIIEIGIVVVDSINLVIKEKESIIVKPQSSKVSDFCEKLTSLTQKDVDSGMLLSDAVNIIKNKYKSKNRTFLSWGDFDRKIFQKNCIDYNIEYPFGPRHINFKNTFSIFEGLNKEFGLSEAMIYDGCEFEGIQHRALFDAFNTAKFFIKTLKLYRGLLHDDGRRF